ncbi:DNA topoisomerase 2 [Camellia lanceoleosa]|uniref:DNA topoisomerase 2 n=1 Tax=Camellia lanceoleosa TaxID=1840588 RepID=A0ACC0FA71_9ERIC|nr:DNA topoisomerase 2 [Camellia lanceoleosa]
MPIRVDLEFPKVEVRFQDLCVDAFVLVGSKALPIIPNFIFNMTEVSFVNSIATIKGGTHVDYVTNQITNYVMSIVNKQNKNANLKAHAVKIHLWVFVNALIDNPAFDSQTKETLTIRQSSFGSKCELSQEFLKKVSKSGMVESLLSWADFKQSKDLKKTVPN